MKNFHTLGKLFPCGTHLTHTVVRREKHGCHAEVPLPTPNPCRAHVTLPGHSEGTREIWPHSTHAADWPGYELGVHRFDPWASRVGYV